MYRFLQEEEAARIDLLQGEEEHKRHIMKKKTDSITQDILTLSHAVIAVENQIASSDTQFLQVCAIQRCFFSHIVFVFISRYFFVVIGTDSYISPNYRITRIPPRGEQFHLCSFVWIIHTSS